MCAKRLLWPATARPLSWRRATRTGAGASLLRIRRMHTAALTVGRICWPAGVAPRDAHTGATCCLFWLVSCASQHTALSLPGPCKRRTPSLDCPAAARCDSSHQEPWPWGAASLQAVAIACRHRWCVFNASACKERSARCPRACRPLLGTTWPELTRHYLEAAAAAGATALSDEARAALAALRKCDYAALAARDRLALLEALLQAAADAETLHKCGPLLGFSLSGLIAMHLPRMSSKSFGPS